MHNTQVGGPTTSVTGTPGTLITGATGFVGGELLVKLLRDSDRSIICPVRAGTDNAARDRGQDRLTELVGPGEAELYRSRVRWLRADIEERQLGWSDMQFHRVASQTHEIFHCAASVSFDLPLDQAQRINVRGTVHLFELAKAAASRHGSFRRFHHVSTAYVAGITKGRVSSDFLPPDRGSLYRNTYERTKARAERYLRAEASSRVPVTIHRPSIIAGDRFTGRTTNWNVIYVPVKMVAKGQLAVFPRAGREICDTVAVDFLVEAMVAFADLDTKRLESHHITAGPSAFTITDLIRSAVRSAQDHGDYAPSDTKMLGRLRWGMLTRATVVAAQLPASCGRVRKLARLARRGLEQCAVYVPYTRVNVVYDATRDHDELRVLGIEMPAGQQYLDTLLDYALTTNFGRNAADTPVDTPVDASALETAA